MNKTEQKAVDRQPFEIGDLIQHFGMKSRAYEFAISLGDALLYSDEREQSDTEFELQFWNGQMFMDETELPDPDSEDHLGVIGCLSTYDAPLRAQMILCENKYDRKFLLVRYDHRDDYIGWWLER
jgi:hypothetical protein